MKKLSFLILSLVSLCGSAFAAPQGEGYYCQLTQEDCLSGRYSIPTYTYSPSVAINTCIGFAQARQSPICRLALAGLGQPSIYSTVGVPGGSPAPIGGGYYCQLTTDTCVSGRYSFPTYSYDPGTAIQICLNEASLRNEPACRVAFPGPGQPAIWGQ